MADYRQISVAETDGVTIVHFNDRRILDAGLIQQLGEDLFQLVEEEQRDKLLLNFVDVEFLSSAALNRLIMLDKKVKERGGTLKLCNICGGIMDVFVITRLDKHFEIIEDESTALAAF
ncbi:MAG: STAS domain-containing protein [Pirellulaceae bacterium]|jgi:anti-sigma B factor antagonist